MEVMWLDQPHDNSNQPQDGSVVDEAKQEDKFLSVKFIWVSWPKCAKWLTKWHSSWSKWSNIYDSQLDRSIHHNDKMVN